MRYLSFSLFIIVGSLLLVLVHRYLWRRLVLDTGLTGRARKAATAGIIGLAVLVPVAMIMGRFVARSISQPLAIVAFSWMGFLAFLLLTLALVDLGRWVERRTRRRAKVKAPPTPEPVPAVVEAGQSRRQFLARATGGASIAASAGVFAIGTKNAFGEVMVQEVPVTLPRLPKALDGFTIVQITDVHIGAMLDGRFLDGVVETINRQKPDLVVITGDLVDGSPALIGSDVARLRKIVSRHGSLFVTGNHEYYSGAPEWLDFLRKLGIRPLMNERVIIGDPGPRGASFDVAGIPDKQGSMFEDEHVPNLAAALAGRDRERELILLAHRPNPIHEAAEGGVGLQLSGHTHGGQFFPINLIGELVHPYNAGLHQHNDLTQIYVSRGTGFWGPPLRLFAPAEVTTVRLIAG